MEFETSMHCMRPPLTDIKLLKSNCHLVIIHYMGQAVRRAVVCPSSSGLYKMLTARYDCQHESIEKEKETQRDPVTCQSHTGMDTMECDPRKSTTNTLNSLL